MKYAIVSVAVKYAIVSAGYTNYTCDINAVRYLVPLTPPVNVPYLLRIQSTVTTVIAIVDEPRLTPTAIPENSQTLTSMQLSYQIVS